MGRICVTFISVLTTTENVIFSRASTPIPDFWIIPLCSSRELDWNDDHLTLSLQAAPWVLPLHPSRVFTLRVPQALHAHLSSRKSLLALLSELALSLAVFLETLAGQWELALRVMWPLSLLVIRKHLTSQHWVLSVFIPADVFTFMKELKEKQKQVPAYFLFHWLCDSVERLLLSVERWLCMQLSPGNGSALSPSLPCAHMNPV